MQFLGKPRSVFMQPGADEYKIKETATINDDL